MKEVEPGCSFSASQYEKVQGLFVKVLPGEAGMSRRSSLGSGRPHRFRVCPGLCVHERIPGIYWKWIYGMDSSIYCINCVLKDASEGRKPGGLSGRGNPGGPAAWAGGSHDAGPGRFFRDLAGFASGV